MSIATAAAVADLAPLKPRLRGWLHLLTFEASLCLGTLLIATAPTDRRLAACIFAAR